MLDKNKKEKIFEKVNRVVSASNVVEFKEKKSQLQNLRELARKDVILDEFILYVEYQKARKQLPGKFSNELLKVLQDEKNSLFKDPDAFKYFIGNLVRKALAQIK